MSLVVKETGGTFTPAPEGVHGAVCIDVIDKGKLTSEWQGRRRERYVLIVRWAIDELRDDGKNYFIEQWYTASLNEKATLRAHLELWRGKKFTPEELAGFDVEKLIGAGCQIAIIHAEKGGKVYANVKGIMPLPKGVKAMAAPSDYVRVKDRPDTEAPVAAGNGSHGGHSPFDADDDDLPF